MDKHRHGGGESDSVADLFRTLRPLYPVSTGDVLDPVEVVRFAGHTFVRSWRGPWVLTEDGA
jgi:hypothetical protein